MHPRELSRLVTKDFEGLTKLLDEWRGVLNPFLRASSSPVFALSVVIPALSAVADGDVVLRFTPGFEGRLVGIQFYTTSAVTTASRSATLQPRIADLPTTGGSLFLQSADLGTKGASILGAPITSRNVFTKAQEITIVADSPAVFSEGAGVVVLTFK